MAEVLQVEKRDQMGSLASRRLRQAGRVPAVLYGHGEENAHLSIPVAQVQALVRHHSKTVELAGAVKDTALVSHIHWDPLGIDVLHMDLIRVNLKELVDVSLSVHVFGDPAGVHEGGILIENTHEVDVRCPAGAIPEHIRLNVSTLGLGASMTAAELELPEGVELVTPADTVIAHVEAPRKAAAAADDADAASEPEVIAKGGEKEEEDS
jgi:large subunit ribosomal protein L25